MSKVDVESQATNNASTSNGVRAGLTVSKKDDINKSSNKNTILALIQVLVLVLISGFLVASLLVNVLKKRLVGGLEIWKWCTFAISVLCGFTIVLCIYWPVLFLVEKTLGRTHKEVVYFVYGLRKCGAFFIWWVWVLLMWLILMEQEIKKRSPRASKVLSITTRTIISLAIGSFAWILVTIGLRLLSVKCRFNRYIDRIDESACKLDLLRKLSTKKSKADGFPGCSCFPKRKQKESENKGPGETEQIMLNQGNSDTYRFLNWENSFNRAYQGLHLLAIKKNDSLEEEALKVATTIFDNLVESRTPERSNNNRSTIEFQEMAWYICKHHTLDRESLKLVCDTFKATELQTIDKKSFTNWVTKVYQDRNILFQALNDNKSATKQLDRLVRIILVIMGTIGWLIWIDVLSTKLLIAFLASLAGGTAMFGDPCRMLFQSIMFVFVVHPFDIGDKCIIDQNELVVDQMNILSTIFLNANNKITYFPNYDLSSKPISNISRSVLPSHCFNFSIEKKTTLERIATLKDKIKEKLETSSLILEGFDDQGNIKMALKFTIKHKVQQNIGEPSHPTDRRSDVILELMKILHELNIKCSFLSSTENVSSSVDATKANILGK